MVDFEHDAIRDASKTYANRLYQTADAEVKLVDLLVANGVNVDDLQQDAQKVKPEEMHPARVAVDAGVVASFTARNAKLVMMSPTVAKDLSDKDKAERRHWKMQLGSIRNKRIVKALDKRLNPDKYARSVERTDDNVWFTTWLADGKKRCETSETFNGDLVALTEWLEEFPLSD
jgi:cell division septation protein DedD